MVNKVFSNFVKSFNPLSALSSVGMSYFNNLIAQKFQRDSMIFQNDLQMKNWRNQFDIQNARQDYLMQNSATIQKNAMEQAGFSPAMMNGGNFQVGAVSNPSGQAVSQGPFMGASLLDFMRLSMDKEALDKRLSNETKVAEAQARNLNSSADGQDIDNKYKDRYHLSVIGVNLAQEKLIGSQNDKVLEDIKLVGSQVEKNRAEIDKINEEIVKIGKENNILDAEYSAKLIENSWLPTYWKNSISLQLSQIKTNNATSYNLYAQAAKAYKEIDKVDEEINNLKQTWRLTFEQTEKVRAECASIEKDTSLKEFELKIKHIVGEKNYAAMIANDETRKNLMVLFSGVSAFASLR